MRVKIVKRNTTQQQQQKERKTTKVIQWKKNDKIWKCNRKNEKKPFLNIYIF